MSTLRSARTYPDGGRGPEALRFWRCVAKTDTCWLWIGRVGRDGYGRFTLADGRQIVAHRWAYTALVGPIPDGLNLDHVRARGCTNRHCVNPAHLEPVTQRVNVLRGDAPMAINARKTHCAHGHEFTKDNTYVTPSGSRTCRACAREVGRRTDARRGREFRRHFGKRVPRAWALGALGAGEGPS